MSTRIFIVEDERIVAEDIRMTLESFGYAVAGLAASRDQALAEIRRTSPDLVLMDIVLKGPGDGVETARLVREQFDIPVVFLTAHADNATLHRAKVTEPFGYILKPFEGHELYSGVEIALYRHQVEKRIDAHERWLATILASIGDGVIAADAMGLIKFVNAAAERISGWKQAEVAGCDLAEIYRVWDESGETPNGMRSGGNLSRVGRVRRNTTRDAIWRKSIACGTSPAKHHWKLPRCPRCLTIRPDRKSTRLNSSHLVISYAV